ncbi:hypothetical protein V6N11_069293 [Hibiscus sabdariffa]
MLPPGLVNNLQEVLSKKAGNNNKNDDSTETSTSSAAFDENDRFGAVVLVTNGEGVDSLGLVYLVQALVGLGLYNVNVCAPQSDKTDKSLSGHSVTVRKTITVATAEIDGTIAYEVSGTPVDCVSLALSGALFSWSKPLLVISGINRGSSCGHHMYHSGVVSGAREAFISGIPSLSLSLNWKKEESQESDFKDAVAVSLPLISTAIGDIEKGVFPKTCFLSIEIPTSPSANKGAARRGTTQSKNEEVESVGAAKSDTRVKKYFRLEFIDKESKETAGDLDFKALDDGFIAVTPLSVSPQLDSDIQTAASSWISGVLSGGGGEQ